jgi:sialate O-acetylesterase
LFCHQYHIYQITDFIHARMKKIILLTCILGFSISISAAIRLPKIFSDNMVLQRDAPVKIWGWADRQANISVMFQGQTAETKSNSKGFWMVTLKPMSHGGPFEMRITERSKEPVVLANILIGDVWLGSGQSNMEWVVKNSNNASEEIAEGNYDKIRLFTVGKAMRYSPMEDVAGGPWQVCSSQTVGDFSAVAYFFGRKLFKELDVPIGLINSSWGGTNIETWISWDIMSLEEDYKTIDPKAYASMAKENASRVEKYDAALKQDKGLSEKWYDVSYPANDWKKMEQPQEWRNTELGGSDGIVWFRKEVELPADVQGQPALLGLGPVDDGDDTYVNGKLVGSSREYTKNRQYSLEPGMLKAGRNVIVVKVTDTGGGGGLYGKQDQVFLEINGKRFSLAGAWDYKSSVLTSDFGIKETGPNTFPSQLYNAMIAPLTSFTLKGVIWYQGESNASKAKHYQVLFPSLIKNWRNKWGYDFPFLWVQLANFMAPAQSPKESQWAELREAQSLTLKLPATGQAIAIDIGEAKDIHPRNKQDVGLRLALSALKVAYNKDVVHSGPVFKSMTTEGQKIKLSFTNAGGGLYAKDKYGYVKGFAIAGSDKKYVWAKAHVEGDQVVVYNDQVKDPISVRYAWGDNPDDANLYNKEGLPACPFRTDQ